MKKLLSALLLIAMLVVALASCGGGSDPEETTPSTTTPPPTTTTPPPTTTDPWEAVATDVKAMDASLRTFKFQMTSLTEAAFQMKCDELMQGPDSADKVKTTIDQLVYDRNKAAADKLGIGTITYVYTAEAWGQQAAVIQGITADAANTEAPDMFAYVMFDTVFCCFSKCFRELSTIDGSYFDWSQDGWYYDIMEDMSFDREKIYVMASDYFDEVYRNFMILPFNMTMFDNAVAELGAIFLPEGQSLKTGEFLSDYLFQMVLDGKWTWDVFTQVCEKIYIDKNNDGKEDAGDRMGIYLDNYGGNMASASLYSTAIKCLEDKIGAPAGTPAEIASQLEGKLVPTYPATGDAINKVFVAIGKLMKANGSTHFSSKNNTNNTGWFNQGLGLTPGLLRLGELEHEDIQTMTDTVSVLPIPLLEAGTKDDYNTCVHNTAALGTFNINSPKFLAMSAYIQHVSENSEAVRTEYLQVVMKFKNTQFNLGTSDMLDLIYANVQSVREMILDNVLRAKKNATIFTPEGLGDPRWHGLIKSGGYTMAIGSVDGSAFLDKYETNLEAKQRGMNELMIEWYALPTNSK